MYQFRTKTQMLQMSIPELEKHQEEQLKALRQSGGEPRKIGEGLDIMSILKSKKLEAEHLAENEVVTKSEADLQECDNLSHNIQNGIGDIPSQSKRLRTLMGFSGRPQPKPQPTA